METTYFVLGMLTIAATILLGAVVVGLLKINKLTNRMDKFDLTLMREMDSVYRQLDDRDQQVWRQLEDTGREVSIVEKNIADRIDREIESTHRHIQHEVQELQKHEESLHNDIYETRRYIDSRIDKVVLSGTLKEPKRQNING